jgi:hypothetical protein
MLSGIANLRAKFSFKLYVWPLHIGRCTCIYAAAYLSVVLFRTESVVKFYNRNYIFSQNDSVVKTIFDVLKYADVLQH